MSEDLFVCFLCDTKFQQKYNLKRHVITHHSQSQPDYSCGYCRQSFARKDYLLSHARGCGENSKYKDKCPLCDFRGSKLSLSYHFRKVHNIQTESDLKTFSNIEEFTAWKTAYEIENVTKYVKVTNYSRGDGAQVFSYSCYRNGYYHSKGSQQRNIKFQGSNKINGWCPADMKVILDKEGEVTAIYTITHVGHELDLERFPLAKEEKDDMAMKLEANIPINKIIDDVRDNITKSERLKRIHLLTRRDLENIKTRYKIRERASKGKTSEDIENEDFSQESDIYKGNKSAIRLHKEPGSSCLQYPKLLLDDFVLIIMSNVQAKLLKSFGNRCIYIDYIPKRRFTSFELLTLLIIDDRGHCFPCAYLYTNSAKANIVEVFFLVIKTVVKCVKTNVFLSDVNDKFYKVWCEVMETPKHRFFSSLYVWMAWKRNLKQAVRNEDLKKTISHNLSIILEGSDREDLQTLLKKFITELYSNEQSKPFALYFNTMFMHSAEMWAYCYRPEDGIKMDMQSERMHWASEYIYSYGRSGRKIGDLVGAIMKFVRNEICNWTGIDKKNYISTKILDLKKKHDSCEEMDCQIFDWGSSWEIVEYNKLFTIKSANTQCECNIRCALCTACVHSFSCSCTDSTLKGNMCKHIHYFCMKTLTNVKIDCDSDPPYPNETTVAHETCSVKDKSLSDDSLTINCIESQGNEHLVEAETEHINTLSEDTQERELGNHDSTQELENANIESEHFLISDSDCSDKVSIEETGTADDLGNGDFVNLEDAHKNDIADKNYENYFENRNGHCSQAGKNTQQSLKPVHKEVEAITRKENPQIKNLELEKNALKIFLEDLLKEINSEEQLEIVKEAATTLLSAVKALKEQRGIFASEGSENEKYQFCKKRKVQ